MSISWCARYLVYIEGINQFLRSYTASRSLRCQDWVLSQNGGPHLSVNISLLLFLEAQSIFPPRISAQFSYTPSNASMQLASLPVAFQLQQTGISAHLCTMSIGKLLCNCPLPSMTVQCFTKDDSHHPHGWSQKGMLQMPYTVITTCKCICMSAEVTCKISRFGMTAKDLSWCTGSEISLFRWAYNASKQRGAQHHIEGVFCTSEFVWAVGLSCVLSLMSWRPAGKAVSIVLERPNSAMSVSSTGNTITITIWCIFPHAGSCLTSLASFVRFKPQGLRN